MFDKSIRTSSQIFAKILFVFTLLAISVFTQNALTQNQSRQALESLARSRGSAGNIPGAQLHQAASLHYGKLTLQDGTEITGIVNYTPQQPLVHMVTEGKNGQRELEYINPAIVKNMEQMQAKSDLSALIKEPLKQPLTATLHSINGQTLSGTIVPSQHPSQILVIPEGKKEPVATPLQALVRISITEGTQPPQQTQSQQTQPHQATPYGGQLPQVPYKQVTLHDGSTIEGQVQMNLHLQIVSVAHYDDSGHAVLDNISTRFVKQISDIPPEQTKDMKPFTGHFTSQLKGTLKMVNGKTITGKLILSPHPAQYIIVPEGSQQPTAIPIQFVVHAIIEETGETLQSGAQQGQTKTEQAQKSQEKKKGKDTYTEIPIGERPDNPPAIPSVGTKVAIHTNLSQLFEGTIKKVEGDWITLSTEKIQGMELSPPQLSLIHRQNITSIKKK